MIRFTRRASCWASILMLLMHTQGLHEFDELMRSGATMKVSLTPDRLKSMEVRRCSARSLR